MSKLPSTGPSLQRWLRQQERKAQRQQQSSAFARSGTSVTAEGVVTVAGAQQSADFDGDLATRDAGSAGWAMNAGAAAFGDLILRPGSVNNDALTSPVVPQGVWFYAQNFAVTTAAGTFASSTITVPAGMTSAVVTVVSRLAVVNSTAAADYLSCVSKIAGSGGLSLQHGINAGFTDFNVSPFSKVLSGLTPGGTFLLEVQGNTAVATWAANAANTAEMTGTILWFR